MPLLGNAEKGELERLILAQLKDYHGERGPGALLAEGVRVVVTVEGVSIDEGQARDPLAAVEVRSLFTALCYLDSPTLAIPRDALASLATEATSAAAAQINRITSG